MIKFRQKEYSSKTMRVLAKVKRGLHNVDTKLTNKLLDAHEKLRPTKGPKVRISPKTNRQINKETIKTVRGVQETAKKVLETPINEGLDKGLKYAAGNPLTAVGQVSPIPGTGLALMGLEGAIKPRVPIYEGATKRLQEGYAGSKFSRNLRDFKLPSIKAML